MKYFVGQTVFLRTNIVLLFPSPQKWSNVVLQVGYIFVYQKHLNLIKFICRLIYRNLLHFFILTTIHQEKVEKQFCLKSCQTYKIPRIAWWSSSRICHFHHCSPGSIPGLGTKISYQAPVCLGIYICVCVYKIYFYIYIYTHMYKFVIYKYIL